MRVPAQLPYVLDCSGSMRDLTLDGISKFTHAKKALTQVLADVVPKGTTVSLWTFSQLPEGVPIVNGYAEFNNDTIRFYDEPERTINRLRPPSRWEPDQSIALLGRLDQLTPYMETPLVEAMWKAASTDLRGEKKMKTLLVLTDGMDTRFGKNRNFFPEIREIPAFIPKFNELGVRVNMVFFHPPTRRRKLIRQEKISKGRLVSSTHQGVSSPPRIVSS